MEGTRKRARGPDRGHRNFQMITARKARLPEKFNKSRKTKRLQQGSTEATFFNSHHLTIILENHCLKP
jgi:hypothetical protein